MPILQQQEARPQVPEFDRNYQWIGNYKLQYTDQQLQSAPTWIQDSTTHQYDPVQLLRDLPSFDVAQLNHMQTMWMKMVMDSISNKSQLLLIVNGTAGTGKSTVYSSISHALPAQQVVRAAFTASAAFLIRGSTLHSFFSLPVESSSKKTFSSLSGINARLFQEKFRPISLLIIDEYSMLSKAMLCMIDRRLRDMLNPLVNRLLEFQSFLLETLLSCRQ